MTAVSVYSPRQTATARERQKRWWILLLLKITAAGGCSVAAACAWSVICRRYYTAGTAVDVTMSPKQITTIHKTIEWMVRLLQRIANTVVITLKGSSLGCTTKLLLEAKEEQQQLEHQQKEHKNQQKEIIQYWFGKEPSFQHKHLWMIADPHRKAIADCEIAQKYQHLLLRLGTCKDLRQQWCGDDTNYQGHLACIIVLDQFSRHVFRYYAENSTNNNTTTIPITSILTQEQMDKIAFEIALQFQSKYSIDIKSGQMPLHHYIFSLMPYRHASSVTTTTSTDQQKTSLQYVQSCIEHSVDMQDQLNQLLTRFRNATNRRATTTATTSTQNLSFSDEDILECFPFQADTSLMLSAQSHPVAGAIQQFLSDFNNTNDTSIVVSLSGGIDSMVIAFVLAHMYTNPTSPLFRNNNNNTTTTIYAAHVDYANRPESASEAHYVERFCQQYNIQFHSCRIEEVTRGVTMREEYERISRTSRFQLYKNIISSSSSSSSTSFGIMLGHHRGDLRENVLSNACRGCGPLELSGMDKVGKIEGVTIWRPLLSIEKNLIYDFAHKFGVPYFKDTTPLWSTRGKLRNHLLPLLQNVYGDGSLTNLNNLALESQACKQLFVTEFIQPFHDVTTKYPMGISFETSQWNQRGVFFWKVILRDLLHSVGRGMFTEKSVASFVERIRVPTKPGWLQCRKDYAVYLEKNGTVYIFHPESFPWAQTDKYCLDGNAFELGTESRIGPWCISAEVLETADELETRVLLARKAYLSLHDLMEGTISYYLKIPRKSKCAKSSTGLLQFANAPWTKVNRPLAWKNTDEKVQGALPLIECSPEALGSLSEDETSFTLVRIQLTLAQ